MLPVDAIANALQVRDGPPRPTKAICLALRQVAFSANNAIMSTRGATQLAAFSAMLDGLGLAKSDATVYDPFFKEADRTLLLSLGFHAPESAFGSEKEPTMPHLKDTTLLWSPGYLANTLWTQNWSPDDVNKIVAIDGTRLTPLNCTYAVNTWLDWKG